eukprot:m.401301 g.401301  ORF g.401301 m.401301 type:complete len:641 (+) comp28395_c2_seq45:368-2290(+)
MLPFFVTVALGSILAMGTAVQNAPLHHAATSRSTRAPSTRTPSTAAPRKNPDRTHSPTVQPSPPGQSICQDVSDTWVDSNGDDCELYRAAKWCAKGGYGSNWGDSAIDFSKYSTGGQHAGTVCCVCGGGVSTALKDTAPAALRAPDGGLDLCHMICGNTSRKFVCTAGGGEFESACHARCAGHLEWDDGACPVRPPCITCGSESGAVCMGGQTFLNKCWARCMFDEPWESGTCEYVAQRSWSTKCSSCPDDFDPVCGNNGAVTYPNSCHAKCAGQDRATAGACSSDEPRLALMASGASTTAVASTTPPTSVRSTVARDPISSTSSMPSSPGHLSGTVWVAVAAVMTLVVAVVYFVSSSQTRTVKDPVQFELGERSTHIEHMLACSRGHSNDNTTAEAQPANPTSHLHEPNRHEIMAEHDRESSVELSSTPPRERSATGTISGSENLSVCLGMIERIVCDEDEREANATNPPPRSGSGGVSNPTSAAPVCGSDPTHCESSIVDGGQADSVLFGTPLRPRLSGRNTQQTSGSYSQRISSSPKWSRPHALPVDDAMPLPPPRPSRRVRPPNDRTVINAGCVVSAARHDDAGLAPERNQILQHYDSPLSPWRQSALQQSPLRSRPRSFRSIRDTAREDASNSRK